MDMLDLARYFAGLVLVLGLLAGFAWLLRRGMAQGLFPGLASQSGERRISISETQILDPRRRIIIVKVDDKEHTLLLGVAGETLIETREAKPVPVFEPEIPDEGPVS